MKQWHSTASQQQVDRIRKAFSTDGLVPLDTIILQKLVIRNLKSGMRSHAHMYCIPFCYYALIWYPQRFAHHHITHHHIITSSHKHIITDDADLL